eukprot:TRINITY_DN132_c0_g2_i2.p2 TRINITY_DN132_c0_g2~~TRINITY_DN132_c0_g2_i2.p2  ORF type:complete len:61 (-),score=2.39 TRINITY_DN132_c0_g2_i2:33-215(-)
MSIIHSFVHEEYVKTSEESDFDGIPSEIFVTYRGRHYIIRKFGFALPLHHHELFYCIYCT